MDIVREPQLGSKKKAALLEGPFFYPLQCIWSKTKKSVFQSAHGELAFEKVGRIRVVAGDPRAKSLADQVKVYQAFKEESKKERATVCGYYFSEAFAKASGEAAHACGVSRFSELRSWSLEGAKAEEARRAIKKAETNGLKALQVNSENLSDLERPILDLISSWKRSKGWVLIKFLLSEPEESLRAMESGSEIVFACLNREGTIAHALVSLRRYFGRSHWYFDTLVQAPDGDRFAIDYVMTQAIEWLKAQRSAEVVSLGFCPGIIERPGTFVEKTLNFWKKTRLLYSPLGLYNFKRKYSDLELPRYLLVSPEKGLWRQLLAMEIVTLFLRRN